MHNTVPIRKSRFVLLLIFCIAFVTAASCECMPSPSIGIADESRSEIASEDNASIEIIIEGYTVDERGFLVIAPFMATLTNNETNLSTEQRFSDGAFVLTVAVPEWAAIDNELFLNITSRDLTVFYGSASFTLNETEYYVNETLRQIDIYVENPPKNYNALIILLLIIALGAILGAYAIFAHWLIMKTVAKRAEQILIQRRKQGGGGGNP